MIHRDLHSLWSEYLVFALAVAGMVQMAAKCDAVDSPARLPIEMSPDELPRRPGERIHPPLENPANHSDDLAAISWTSFVSAVIGVTVFVILVPVYRRVFRMLIPRSQKNHSIHPVICPGNYTAADASCTLSVYKSKRLPPLLNLVKLHESYFLRIGSFDLPSGVASGWLQCTSHANHAGEWFLAPLKDSPNSRMLTVKVGNQPPNKVLLVRNT